MVTHTGAEAEEMSYLGFMALLLAEEVADSAEACMQRATRKAGFPFLRPIEPGGRGT